MERIYHQSNLPPDLKTAIERAEELIARIQEIDADLGDPSLEKHLVKVAREMTYSEFLNWLSKIKREKVALTNERRFLKLWITEEQKRLRLKSAKFDLNEPDRLLRESYFLFKNLKRLDIILEKEEHELITSIKTYLELKHLI